MKYKDIRRKMTKDAQGFNFIGLDIMVGENKVPCLSCKEPSEYIDIFSEAHFCSSECKDAFYQELDAQERMRDGAEDL